MGQNPPTYRPPPPLPPLVPKSACSKGKIILVKFMSWDLWRVYTSTCSPLQHIFVMQFLKTRALVFYHVREAGVFCKMPNNCQTPNNSTSNQGYETEWLEFQVSLPSILGASMEPGSHCFLTLITKLQSHLALRSSSAFFKIPLQSIYNYVQ